MSTVRFYAADLAAYNNGYLHGAWIEASSDAEGMREAVDAMLSASPVADAEEWLIHDYDDALSAISHLGETSDLSAIAEIMEAVEEIEDEYDDSVLPILLAWVADRTVEPHSWKATLEDAFGGIWRDAEDYAADLAESCGYMTGTDNPVMRYIDFKAMARDMALGGEMDFVRVSDGAHLQQYDDMRGFECIALRNL